MKIPRPTLEDLALAAAIIACLLALAVTVLAPSFGVDAGVIYERF